MLRKRIIPCLDVKDGIVVKGRNFVDLKQAGDPAELAKRYYEEGADEIALLDITASCEGRKTMLDVVENVAKQIFIPLTVGGGIKDVSEINEILRKGADKVSLNTSAIRNPDLITEASQMFGRQCVVVAIDARRNGDSWDVYVKGGRKHTAKDAIEWAKEAERLGAGEILLTSMDRDGTKQGYDIELMKKICQSVNIPVIASGGAGSIAQIKEVLEYADAALCASIFHYGKYSVMDVKKSIIFNGRRTK